MEERSVDVRQRARWADEPVRLSHRAPLPETEEDGTMIWTLIGLLVLFWLLGFIGHVGGSLIHLLLVVAVVIFIVDLLTGRRTAA